MTEAEKHLKYIKPLTNIQREREREKNEKDKDRVDRDIVHKWNEHIKQLTMRKSFS